jgi:hypothetical protein
MGMLTTLLSQLRCVGGGAWSHPPTKQQIQQVSDLAKQKADESLRARRVVQLNIPGLVTYYIAPSDLVSQLPNQWRGSTVMRTKSRRPKEDRLAEKVEYKTKAQLRSNTGILVVYDRFSSPDEMRGFFDHKDIELVIATFKNLAGVALVFPFTAIENAPPILERKERRVYIRHCLSGNEYESCVIWGNIMANHDLVIERFVESMRDYPGNLDRLFADRA